MVSRFKAIVEKRFCELASFFILFAGASSFSYAQTISGSQINAGYGDLNNSLQLTYSIGDLFYGELTDQGLFLTGMLYRVDENVPTALTPENRPGFSFYPNPCQSLLYVKTSLETTLTIRFYNLNGVLVRNEKLMENQVIDLSGLADGVYLMQISDKDLNFYIVEKLIKTN